MFGIIRRVNESIVLCWLSFVYQQVTCKEKRGGAANEGWGYCLENEREGGRG